MPRPSSPGALRSSSGAFDLPSIITGVVVVGILTAGVLAAIFGVIPFVQNNAAKQDLMAINTAQGVTYAKDGQKYKDLTGLEDAGLISGMNPEKTEVTTSNEGKGFRAVVTSGTGQKWFITHENSVPQELKDDEDPADEAIWTGQWCSPETAVGTEVKATYEAFMDPDSIEYMKVVFGGPVNMDRVAEWSARHPSVFGSNLEDEDLAAVERSGHSINNALLHAVAGLSAPPATDQEWADLHTRFLESFDRSVKEWCSSFAGPVPYWLEEHPQRQEAWIDKVHGLTGSSEPITLGFTLEFGKAGSYEVTANGAEQIPGYKSQRTAFSIVDGKPYWEVSLLPGSSGWGNSAGEYPLEVTVRRPGAAPDSDEVASRQWTAKVNPTSLKIMAPSDWAPTAYGDSWDKVVRHAGSGSTNIHYRIQKFQSPGGPGSEDFDPEIIHNRIVNLTGDMEVEALHKMPLSIELSAPLNADWERPLGVGSATVARTVMDPVTFARASHEFKLTITDPSSAPAPKLKVRDITPSHRDDARNHVIEVENPYHEWDYGITVTYDGQTASDSMHYFALAPDANLLMTWGQGSGWSELQSNNEFLVGFNLYDYRASGSGKLSVPEMADVTITYKPSGKSTTVQVPVPQVKNR